MAWIAIKEQRMAEVNLSARRAGVRIPSRTHSYGNPSPRLFWGGWMGDPSGVHVLLTPHFDFELVATRTKPHLMESRYNR